MTRVVDSAATVKPSSRDLRELLIGAIGTRRARPATGPKALMFAVLEEAVRSYFSGKVRVREEADRWINTRNARTLFSFTVVCETLDLEPNELSNRLYKLRMRAHSRRAITSDGAEWRSSANRLAQQMSRHQPTEPMPYDATPPLRAQRR